MAERKKRGLGRGLGALIPDAVGSTERPVDVFFTGGDTDDAAAQHTETQRAPRTARTDPAASMQSSRRRKAKAAKAGSTTAKAPAARSSSAEEPAAKAAPAKAAAAKSTATKASTTKSASAKDPSATTAKSASAAKKPAARKSAASTRSTTRRSGTAAAPGSRPAARVESESTDAAVNSASEALEAVEATPVDTESVEASPVPQKGGESVGADNSADDRDVVETHPGVFTSETSFSRYDDEDTANVVIGSDVTANTAESDSEASEVDLAPVVGSSDFDQSGIDEGLPVVDESADDASASAADGSAAVEESGEAADGVLSIADTEFGEIDVALIDPNPRQPRTVFDEDQLAELVHSIREIGVLQPVVVRQKPGDSVRYELIMGERRLRATKEAGLESIPAIIRHVADTDLLRDALLENLHRAELNPLEEAAAYGQLLEDFGCTQEELSVRIGRSRPQISNTLRLLKLPPLVQRRVAAGVISAGHARAILGLKQAEHMEVLAQRIVAEGLSVRAAEEAVVLLNRGDSVNVSRGTSRVAPEFLAVAERLGDRLDTKVNITVGKRKGKLSVEFANQEDLDRILGLLGLQSNPW